jgi:hypothetical protein
MTEKSGIERIQPTKTRKGTVRAEERIGEFFLDSGAHSLYNVKVGHHGSIGETIKGHMDAMTPMERFAVRRQMPHVFRKKRQASYDYYESEDFWTYVDTYCQFVIDYQHAIDYYATVDVLFNPKKSWQVLKYIEKEWGLNPVPVIHFNTPLKWVEKHLNAGYSYIGIGGLGQEITKQNYFEWADPVYELLCDKTTHLPLVKTHGFAMTAPTLLTRYPWYSVDSASWAKAGAFGRLYIPRQTRGEYNFFAEPYTLNVSCLSPTKHVKGRNLSTMSKEEQRVVKNWLEQIGVPYGENNPDGTVKKKGVINYHGSRKIANLKFYEAMVASLPDWPWPFQAKARQTKGFH